MIMQELLHSQSQNIMHRIVYNDFAKYAMMLILQVRHYS